MPIAIAVLLVVLAVAIPPLTNWDVHARDDAHTALPPWHGWWEPHGGPGSIPAVIIAVVAIAVAARASTSLRWRTLLLVSYVASLGWLLSLALVDGSAGLSRVLGNPHEYLGTAREVGDIGTLLSTWVSRVPMGSADHWPTHVAGHPPGMLLFFVGLVRVGLGGNLAAGLVVTLIAASIAPAVLITLRRLGAESTARRAAPFLVLSPSAVYLAVSADAVIAALGCWSVAMLAHATATRRPLPAALAAGVLFGTILNLSYGMLLYGLVGGAVILGTRSHRLVLPVAIGAAAALALPLTAGFWWPCGFTALHTRYWEGVASQRPWTYWTWANLALLVATAGPAVAAGLAKVKALPQPILWIVLGACAAVLVADASQMSRAEVERIWLPFVPWLTVAAAAIDDRWQRKALGSQLVVALALQHLLYTTW